MNEIIVSLTSYGNRLKLVTKTIYSILNGNSTPIHIVLTLFKSDLKNIPEDLKLFIDIGLIEIIEAPINLKSHLKYFYVMQKYSNHKIITIDDDIIYPKKFIDFLVENYNKDCIVGNRGHKLQKISKYEYSPFVKGQGHRFLALGAFGVLYPEKVFENYKPDIEEINKILHNDDVYLKLLALRNNKQVKLLNKNLAYLMLDTKNDNLHTENWKGRTQKEMNFFKEEFEKFKL